VRVTGNESFAAERILTRLKTRKGRPFDPEHVEEDKRRLAQTRAFRDVNIYQQRTPQGVVVTFEVFERPTIHHIRFIGNRGLSDKALTKESGIELGDALSVYSVKEARRKIEDLYHSKGYPQAQVSITEGLQPADRGATFYVSEGPLERINTVKFIGNTIASDSRLKTKIQSKPGYLKYLFRGKVDHRKIDEDVERVTAYYRSLGFFQARVSRLLEYDASGRWLDLQLVIDEGPRYLVRNVSLVGSSVFASDALLSHLKLQSGDYFNLDRMNTDVNLLRDMYGGHGYIFADIEAGPRFLEEPGQLDLVYEVNEGNQFRVGKINVHIAGEFPHTREEVVLDRLSLRPGDVVDIREVRASERRLKASQLFVVNPAEGDPPRVVVRPPSLRQTESIASGRPHRAVRGQSPDSPEMPSGNEIELDVYVTPSPQESIPAHYEPQDQQP
jgi:outer membrane protein insertion porin family